MMNSKKILILTMSCNLPYYQGLLGAVKDTWAKPLIQNKYDNITWFGYTSCDEKHPEPVVDFEEHMIYTSAGDELKDTFFKTKEAYNMIKDIVNFDYIVRTNTSIFLNINNLIKKVDEIIEHVIYTETYILNCNILNREIYCIIPGFFFLVNKQNFEYMLMDDMDYFDDSNNDYNNDDVIFSRNIEKYLGVYYDGRLIEDDNKLYQYKSLPDNMEVPESYKRTNFIFTNDPNIINERIAIRLKPIYEINRFSQNEIEHFYELNNMININEG